MSGWGYVRVGLCPVGLCPGGVMSGWGYVLQSYLITINISTSISCDVKTRQYQFNTYVTRLTIIVNSILSSYEIKLHFLHDVSIISIPHVTRNGLTSRVSSKSTLILHLYPASHRNKLIVPQIMSTFTTRTIFTPGVQI